jgi:hypothetical protein
LAPKPSVALAAKIPSSKDDPGPDLAKSGKMTRSGITTRSCSSNMDNPSIPSGLASQFFCFNTGRTNADCQQQQATDTQFRCKP